MNEKNVFHREKARLPSCMEWANRLQVLVPVHTYPDIFENGDFFLRFSLRYVKGVFGHKKCRFSKTVPGVKFF